MGLAFQGLFAQSGKHEGIEMAPQQPFLLRTGARGRQHVVGEACRAWRQRQTLYNLRWWDGLSGGVHIG